MITTVTLNAAIDKTYTVSSFEMNRVLRIGQMIAVAGGKGVNVARVARTLGEPVTAAGFAAGFNGQFIRQGLDAEGIGHDFIEVPGESRLCLTVLDAQNGTQTELLEPGPEIPLPNLEELKSKIASLAAASTHVCFSGSLPAGCPADLYAELIRLAQHAGASAVLDASGDALAAGLEARPLLIKPNEHEIERLLGRAASSDDDLAVCLRQLMGLGIRHVIVSLGGRGALAGSDGHLRRVQLPPVAAVNPVGSGDAMVAGMVTAIRRGYGDADMVRFGAACGSANALHAQAGAVTMEEVERLYREIRVTDY
ncbi:1-phosphofructokinase [Paenibacillus sp. FJAT-26967]|uniref:1-phosphofructokinase n=1 Tax=Paenibacillus sp. FJAT-26967 TaxID=1729690 RepID=UPI0008388061|nr:1-phosphofructokinase [Paenibacillus sp. FJAT-26967]